MKAKIKIAVVIPTYNRLERLKFAVHKIETQEIDNRFELYCVISNIGSKDGTCEYLDQLQSEKIKFVIWNKPELNINLNWLRATEAIPKDIDWVWFHGDDDYLTNEKVICSLVDVLIKHYSDNLVLVHACQARRCQMSGKVIKDTVFGLANSIGYHELLGWMSSLVVRRDKFVPSLLWAMEPWAMQPQYEKAEEYIHNRISAYRHSAGLLRHTANDMAIFVDMPWIEPQDQHQTSESIQRWADSYTSDRYFFVVDDILAMFSDGVLSKSLKPIFFRYLNYSLWDKYTDALLSTLLKTGQINQLGLEHLDRIKKIADHFSLTRDKKLFLQWHHCLCEIIRNYLVLIQVFNNAKTEVSNQLELSQASSYPFQVLEEGGKIPGS